MFDQESWQSAGQPTEQADGEIGETTTIDDIETTDFELIPGIRFLIALGLGAFFFLIPITWNGQITVAFDVVASTITDNYPGVAGVAGLLLITAGGVLSVVAEAYRRGALDVDDRTAQRLDLQYWTTSPIFLVIRILGVVFAALLFFGLGPTALHDPVVGGLVWGTIALSVVVIIPLGAVFVNLLVELGGLEFIGTLARPLMRPLFRLPGRAALDSVASWVGAFTVGYYVTYNVFHRGGYDKRDVFIIATCFAPVSIGFVGVIVSTLGLLHLFPFILFSWLIGIVVTGLILVRVPPLSNVPKEYIAEPDPETAFVGSPVDYIRFALSKAIDEAKDGRIPRSAGRGLIDGLKVTALTLGTVVAISTATLLLIAQTNVFNIISAPLVPVISILGIPDPGVAAAAILISGVEQVSAAAVVSEAHVMARFFVAVVSISQIIFFAASAPMMMDMFNDVPIRFRDLLVLFCMRTAILMPIAAVLTHIINWMEYLS